MRLLTLGCALLAGVTAAEEPPRAWTDDDTRATFASTLEVHLAPDLSELTEAELAALPSLLEAGRLMHQLYLEQRHPQSIEIQTRLNATGNEELVKLFYLFKGPVAYTVDNEKLNFVPASPDQPGKTLYPTTLSRSELDQLLSDSPALADAVLHPRSVVRAATEQNLTDDRQLLDAYPGVAALHPGLADNLATVEADPSSIYAIPYALAYAPQLAEIRNHLRSAAAVLDESSPDFADYLRLRARDFLSSDYEAGDAAWVRGAFAGLNLQIGSYETYDDNLYGVKAFFGASLLARDTQRSEALEKAVQGLQSIEDALPYVSSRRVSSDIPVGVYNVIADFGQARGANTATILPNEAAHARKYGRTILIRNNILTHPEIYWSRQQQFNAVIDDAHHDDLSINGGFERTLWHEVGHYLGASTTEDGRDLGVALAEHASLIEELKADLISLFAAPALLDDGYYDEQTLRAHYADGIRRTLQSAQPRPGQPYQNMQLMQFNFFMEFGLLEPDFETRKIRINYDRYHSTVTDMLEQVLLLQYGGDFDAAAQFIERWNYWEDVLHGQLANMMSESGAAKRTLVTYEALDPRLPVEAENSDLRPR